MTAVRDVELAYKAFDPHELGCHAVAAGLGLYAAERLRPRLVDATFDADDDLGAGTFLVACGAALLARARGAPVRIVFVACERPMFWLCGREGTDLSDLAGRPVATFPPIAPPYAMLAAALRSRGVQGVELRPCRDDASRLGLLRAGDVDAALLSSAVAPVEPPVLLDVGAELAGLPTTGLAVNEATLTDDPELVVAVVRAHRAALAVVRERPDDAARALAAAFGLEAAATQAVRELLDARLAVDGALDAGAFEAAAGVLAADAPALAGLAPRDVLAPLAD